MADKPPENVLPRCLPEMGDSVRKSVRLSAVSEGDEGPKRETRRPATKPAEKQDSKSGEGGIRTPGGCYTTPVFKTGAFGHSATSPNDFTSFLYWGYRMERNHAI